MKKHAPWLAVLLATAIGAFGGQDEKDREELMARMGFSKEEIAKDVAAHNAVTGALGAVAGKSNPKAAAAALSEANEINKLRDLSALRQQAESLRAEAQKRAALAKTRQQEAEAQADVAVRETRRLMLNDGITPQVYGQALDGRDKFLRLAEEAREAAEAAVREAEQVRVTADAAIAKAKSAEARIEAERLARVVAIRDRPPQR